VEVITHRPDPIYDTLAGKSIGRLLEYRGEDTEIIRQNPYTGDRKKPEGKGPSDQIYDACSGWRLIPECVAAGSAWVGEATATIQPPDPLSVNSSRDR
jgi:hypothetical protein